MTRTTFEIVIGTVALLSFAAQANAGHNRDSSIWIGSTQEKLDSAWVVQVPTGTSDFLNVCYDVVSGAPDSESVAQGMPVTGVALSVVDFSSGTQTFPRIGVYLPNLCLDATGCTPFIVSGACGAPPAPIVELTNAPLPTSVPFQWIAFDTGESMIPAGTTKVHAVVQLPDGDVGTLGIGGDGTLVAKGTSFYTTDAYQTAAIPAASVDLGITIGQDNTATTSCKQADRKPHGRLRLLNDRSYSPELQHAHTGSGDHLTTVVSAGESVQLAFFGTKAGDLWRIYYDASPCTPFLPIGPVLPTIHDGDGDGTYLRVVAAFPCGYGGQTFRFSAIWGNAACVAPGVGFTNCVTIITAPDPTYGTVDDGTIEFASSVSNPNASGPSDYASVNFGTLPRGTDTLPCSVNGVVALSLAVWDLGTTAAGFPAAGISNQNFTIDPSGNTPDIANPLALIVPFTFSPLTVALTSGQYVSQPVDVPVPMLSYFVHGWVQFPSADTSLLLGVDSSAQGSSFSSSDGYLTPALPFRGTMDELTAGASGRGNWGIRLRTN